MNIILHHQQKRIEITENRDFSVPDSTSITATDDSIDWLQTVEATASKSFVVRVNNAKNTLRQLRNHFRLIIAGGGIITNQTNEVLLIHRNGCWDLPKGKWDDGETIEECAVREVSEETGLQQISIEKLFYKSYHTYEHKGNWVLKETYWYTMKSSSTEKLIPQTEEGISKVQWVAKEDIPQYFNNMYPNLIDMLLLFLIK